MPHRIHAWRVVFFLTVGGGMLLTGIVHAQEHDRIAVHLKDGRMIEGVLDARTDDRALWLRYREESVSLSSAYAWDTVVGASLGEERLSAADLKQRSDRIKSKLSDDFFLSTREDDRPRPAAGAQKAMRREEHQLVTRRVHDPTPRTIVESLNVEAYLSNWDGDVEADGLEVVIYPLDSQRQSVAVKGTILMRLLGRREDRRTGRVSLGELARASDRVDLEDFVDGVAVYRFPFQTIRPEFDLELAPDALIHVRLGVPGQGNFEATTRTRIRAYDRVRDELQLYDGGRFFPNERTWRTRQQMRRYHSR